MSDLIRREDAIEAFADVLDADFPYVSEVTPMERIEAIPSADRPKGEWNTKFHGNGWTDYWDYTCSNCGKKYERADAILYKANFCPNCGAEMMRGDGNGTD